MVETPTGGRSRNARARNASAQMSARIVQACSEARHFLNSTNYFLKSKTIVCYLSVPEEVDTSLRLKLSRAWRAKKRIFAPGRRRTHRAMSFSRGCDLTRRFSQSRLRNCGNRRKRALIAAKSLDVVITPSSRSTTTAIASAWAAATSIVFCVPRNTGGKLAQTQTHRPCV